MEKERRSTDPTLLIDAPVVTVLVPLEKSLDPTAPAPALPGTTPPTANTPAAAPPPYGLPPGMIPGR